MDPGSDKEKSFNDQEVSSRDDVSPSHHTPTYDPKVLAAAELRADFIVTATCTMLYLLCVCLAPYGSTAS